MSKQHLALLVVVLFTVYIFFFKLGNSYFENWDEAWYAEVTKQMIKSKDFFVLRYNGSIFLDKPPLNIWLNVLFSFIFGLNEFSIRLTSSISAVITVMLVFFFVKRKWGVLPSLIAFGAIILNNVYVWRGRTGNMDSLSTLLFMLIFFAILNKKENYTKYFIIGTLFGLLFLSKATLVYIPVTIWLISDLVYVKKQIKTRIKHYLVTLFFALLFPAIWLLIGTLRTSSSFYEYYLFKADQGVANLNIKFFNTDYIHHLYYSLQRRPVIFLIFGTVFLLKSIKSKLSFLLLSFSYILVIALSFTEKDNNWYLIPSMPFWAIIIGYGFYNIQNFLVKSKIGITLLFIFICASLYIYQKTYRVNIVPIINNQVNSNEVKIAKLFKQLSKKNEVGLRLDFSYPVMIYYSDRNFDYYVNMDEPLIRKIKKQNIRWVIGKNNRIEEFLKLFNEKIEFRKYNKNDEAIVEIISYKLPLENYLKSFIIV